MLAVTVPGFGTDKFLEDEANDVSRNLAKVYNVNAAQESTPGIDRPVRREHQFVGPIVQLRKEERFIVAAAIPGLLKKIVQAPKRLQACLYAGPKFELWQL